jgi:hypothetical protein
MLTRLLFTLAMLAALAVCPWIVPLVLELGKAATFAVLAPIGFAFGASGIALATTPGRTDQ